MDSAMIWHDSHLGYFLVYPWKILFAYYSIHHIHGKWHIYKIMQAGRCDIPSVIWFNKCTRKSNRMLEQKS